MRHRIVLLAAAGLVVAAVSIYLGVTSGSSSRPASKPVTDAVDQRLAYRLLRAQVGLGPRPAGSRASHRLKRGAARLLPRGRLRRILGHPGLHNVVGSVPGTDPARKVIVGAHHDTKDLPGFVGANDGASGVALVLALARSIAPGELEPRLLFILFDGEETPAGTPDGDFLQHGLRGSTAAARRHPGAEAMILLDMVGDRDLGIPRESFSATGLWGHLRDAAREVGTASNFPAGSRLGVLDDHIPFRRRGVPAINVIDFDYPCWHRQCDDLDEVSARSLDAVGETVHRLLVRLWGAR